MQELREIEAQLHDTPDQQISLTDPDARSIATSARGTGAPVTSTVKNLPGFAAPG